MGDLLLTILLGIASGVIALTISKSEFFYPFRGLIERRWENAAKKGYRRRAKALGWLDGLINCPYCTSHWICFGAIALYLPRPIEGRWLWVDIFWSTFLMIFIASVSAGIIYKLFSGSHIHDAGQEEQN